MTGIDKLLKNKSMNNGKEADNMCQAIEELYEDAKAEGEANRLVKSVETLMKNLNLTLSAACQGIGATVDEYTNAKALIKHATFL